MYRSRACSGVDAYNPHKRVREFAHTEIKSPNKTLFKTYACAIY